MGGQFQIWFWIALTLIIVSVIIERWKKRPVKDSPDGTPYTIYTTEFDRAVAAEELSDKLALLSPDYSKGFLSSDRWEWDQSVACAEKIFGNLTESTSATMPPLALPSDMAVTLLIDQSGSMKGLPMENTAAGVRKLMEILTDNRIEAEVIGFTTAGWHGGYARRKWIDEGQPTRPGRLCALLHIIYKSFDEATFSEDAWREMLNPDLLRENIDGEAIEFAEARLQARHERYRVLVVISDGAPVDDSTLTQNGPSFLYRHVAETISRIQAECNIGLCAIGVNYSVAEWYQSSGRADDGQALVEVAIQLISNSKPTSPA